MKALVIIFCMLSSGFIADQSKAMDTLVAETPISTEISRSAMERAIARYFYYPVGKLGITGEAEIMLRVMPEGNVELLMLSSDNNAVKEFVTRQVPKISLAKDEIVAGEVYRYRLCFKRQA